MTTETYLVEYDFSLLAFNNAFAEVAEAFRSAVGSEKRRLRKKVREQIADLSILGVEDEEARKYAENYVLSDLARTLLTRPILEWLSESGVSAGRLDYSHRPAVSYTYTVVLTATEATAFKLELPEAIATLIEVAQ